MLPSDRHCPECSLSGAMYSAAWWDSIIRKDVRDPISLRTDIVTDDSGTNMAAGFMDVQVVSATVRIYLAAENQTWLASFMRTQL